MAFNTAFYICLAASLQLLPGSACSSLVEQYYLKQVDGHPGNVAAAKDDDDGGEDAGNPLVPPVSALDAGSLA